MSIQVLTESVELILEGAQILSRKSRRTEELIVESEEEYQDWLQGLEEPPAEFVGEPHDPDDGTSGDVLLKHADAAMYRAKYSGRDQNGFPGKVGTS